jgi:hypothetical protein
MSQTDSSNTLSNEEQGKTVFEEEMENHENEGEDEVSELKSDFESLNAKFKKRHQQMLLSSSQTNEATPMLPTALKSPSKSSNPKIEIFITPTIDESNQFETSENILQSSNDRRQLAQSAQPETLTEEEEEEIKRKARIERFLSICEIPQSVLNYTQQKFLQISELNANNSKKLSLNGKQQGMSSKSEKGKETEKKNKSESEKGVEKKSKSPLSWFNQKHRVRYYHNGSSLPQQHKKEIIFDIISNYDPENYLKEFKSSLVIEIKLDKK